MTTADVHPPVVAPSQTAEGRYQVSRLPVRRFTVDEYHRMIDAGYFASDERFELLEGWIVAKVPRNPVQDAAVSIAMQLLSAVLPEDWHVRCQSALTTGDSEPEPDLVVVRGVPRDYTARHPGPPDAAVVVEVANSTLADDREIKLRVYARAGVVSYWIVNLVDRTVEVYTQPTKAGAVPTYARRDVFSVGQTISFTAGTTVVGPIAVAEFLP